MLKFNINEHVKVKLTEKGRDIYFHRYDNWLNQYPTAAYVPIATYPEVDEDGYTEIQLWHLMEIFGPSLYNGCIVPFEENNIYFDEDKIKEVEASDDTREYSIVTNFYIWSGGKTLEEMSKEFGLSKVETFGLYLDTLVAASKIDCKRKREYE